VALFVALGGSATAAVLITGGPQATGGSPLSRSGGARGIVVGYLEMLLGPPAA
jgi:hypothetical protein